MTFFFIFYLFTWSPTCWERRVFIFLPRVSLILPSFVSFFFSKISSHCLLFFPPPLSCCCICPSPWAGNVPHNEVKEPTAGGPYMDGRCHGNTDKSFDIIHEFLHAVHGREGRWTVSFRDSQNSFASQMKNFEIFYFFLLLLFKRKKKKL